MASKLRLLVVAAILAAACACAPRLRPLPGIPAPTVLPRTTLPSHPRRIVFQWQLDDPDLTARGDGAARIAPQDSARLDSFTFRFAMAHLKTYQPRVLYISFDETDD